MSKRERVIPPSDWIATVYGAAIFGGAFWMLLAAKTRFFETSFQGLGRIPTPTIAVAAAIIGGVVRLIPVRRAKCIGTAIALGAVLGLPVVGYFAILGR